MTSSTEGPTSGTLPFPQTTSNISYVSQGCDCFDTTTCPLQTPEAHSQITDNCECPEPTDQSDQELVNYENGAICSDGKYDCYCSVPNRFTVSQSPIVDKYSDTTGSSKFDEKANNEYLYQNCTSEDRLFSYPTQQTGQTNNLH